MSEEVEAFVNKLREIFLNANPNLTDAGSAEELIVSEKQKQVLDAIWELVEKKRVSLAGRKRKRGDDDDEEDEEEVKRKRKKKKYVLQWRAPNEIEFEPVPDPIPEQERLCRYFKFPDPEHQPEWGDAFRTMPKYKVMTFYNGRFWVCSNPIIDPETVKDLEKRYSAGYFINKETLRIPTVLMTNQRFWNC